MSVEHELKIWPKYYCRVANGEKTFEVRNNDRDFQTGDFVTLCEYQPRTEADPPSYEGRYTQSEPLKFKIGYVLPIDDKRVVFSLLSWTAKQGSEER